MRGDQAFELISRLEFDSALDIGSGGGEHAQALRKQGRTVTTINLEPPADLVTNFIWHDFLKRFDLIWACHVLEHQPNPGVFLQKCFQELKPGGIFAVTVPPAKHAIVGGHVTLWNAGLLLYQMVLAGFDCSLAAVKSYGYNISVVVRKKEARLPRLKMDCGDLEFLQRFFPVEIPHGSDGRIIEANWHGFD